MKNFVVGYRPLSNCQQQFYKQFNNKNVDFLTIAGFSIANSYEIMIKIQQKGEKQEHVRSLPIFLRQTRNADIIADTEQLGLDPDNLSQNYLKVRELFSFVEKPI